MNTSSTRHVFVYGTLRRGDVRDINALLPRPVFVGDASIAATMYHLGGYPGIRLGGKGRVKGEVYEVSEALERVLDEIEEVWPQQTGEYAKRDVQVELHSAPDGRPPGQGEAGLSPRDLVCFLYEISDDRIAGKPVIHSGDWLLK